MPLAHHLNLENAKHQSVEYTVYIHHPANQNTPYWEKTTSTHDQELALEQAKLLHYTQKYPRVEVKRTFFCTRTNKRIGDTVQVFDHADEYHGGHLLLWVKRVLSYFSR